MKTIAPPTLPVAHPDRALECAEAADVAFHDFLDRLEQAGWSKAESAAAALYLARHRIRELTDHGHRIQPVPEMYPSTSK